MTARDEMAVLFERYILGEELGTTNYDSALHQAVADLDAIASLATNPETAPAVFRWLVEAGVLQGLGTSSVNLTEQEVEWAEATIRGIEQGLWNPTDATKNVVVDLLRRCLLAQRSPS